MFLYFKQEFYFIIYYHFIKKTACQESDTMVASNSLNTNRSHQLSNIIVSR